MKRKGSKPSTMQLTVMYNKEYYQPRADFVTEEEAKLQLCVHKRMTGENIGSFNVYDRGDIRIQDEDANTDFTCITKDCHNWHWLDFQKTKGRCALK